MTDCDAPDAARRQARDAVADVRAAKAADATVSTDDLVTGLADHFVTLADALFLSAGDGVLTMVERVVAAACAIVPGADAVSVVLREPDDRFATVAHHDDVAERADRLADEVGEGPSRSAVERGGLGTALARDLSEGGDWPRFAGRAADELGLRTALSTGMFPGGDPPRFGALNFYSRTPDAFDDHARDHALILAAYAATAISSVRARTAGELREAQLAEALQSRDVIGQAKGILMERRGQSADEAFAVLQRASQDLNIKLRDVAQTLVSHRDEI